MNETTTKPPFNHIKRCTITLLLCLLYLSTTALQVYGETTYPWETEKSQPANQKPQHSSQGVLSQKELHFGRFKVRNPGNWMAITKEHDKDFAGLAIATVEKNDTPVTIIASDDEPFDYADDNDRIRYQNVLAENLVGSNREALKYYKIMSNKTIAIRTYNPEDGTTMFYVLPYDGTSCYALFVVYDRKASKLTKEVRSVLSTLQLSF